VKRALVLLCVLLTGCEGQRWGARETGAVTGAAMGAGLGAIVGNQAGHHAGAGIAIGSAAGAIAGGLIGNSIDKENERLSNLDQQIAERDRMIEENRRIIDELKRRGADARLTKRGVVVNLPDVLFEFDKSNLRSDALRAVREIADVVGRYPERAISVEGHTDSVGTIAYNQRLSEDRARSVAQQLASDGVERRRIRSRGFGESDPIASNRTEEGRARNRRVEVILEN